MSKFILKSIPSIVLVLVLSILSPVTFFAGIPLAHAVVQSGPMAWSPFGPYSRELLITVHSDFQTMFNAFLSGLLDITDWPVQPQDITSLCNDPVFFCTSPQGEFGIFHLDRNHHRSFMGLSQQTDRPPSTTGVTSITTAPSGVCSASSGTLRVILFLEHAESGNSPILDPLNTATITHASAGTPSATVQGSSTSNVYTFPCILAGPYNLKTSVYGGTGTMPQQNPGLDVTVHFSVNYNSASTRRQTTADAEIGRALGHLLDKPSFLNGPQLAGLAEYDDILAGPAQGLVPCLPGQTCTQPASKLPQSVLDEDRTRHSWFQGSVVSAYNLVADSSGCQDYWWALDGCGSNASRGYPGLSDFRASCEHLVAAGFTVINGNCQDLANIAAGMATPACASNPAAYSCPYLNRPGGSSSQIIMYLRTHLPRKAFGQIFGDGLNLLFGTPNHQSTSAGVCAVAYGFLSGPFPPGCAPRFYTITQVFDLVFRITDLSGSLTPSSVDDWDLYTGGFSLGPNPDQLWSLYNGGRFTGSVCSGTLEDYPSNYVLYCNPAHDGDADAAEFSVSLSSSNSFFGRAAIAQHRDVTTIPVYSLVSQFAALNGWNFQPAPRSSLVQQLGHGFQTSFWSLLNMRQVPGYNPCAPPNAPPNCSSFSPGGGNPNLIRRGFSQDVHKLSLFQGLTVWDFEVMLQIYDSMLAVNPQTGGSGSQIIDWMTKSHTSSFNPTEVSCVGTNCVTGTTTQKWLLRNDLKWHDGVPLTAADVAYTILAYRDVPSSNLRPSVATVSSVTTCGPLCVQVKLQQQSPFYELNIGGVPIIPKHIWAPICGDPPSSSSLCADPGYDPMVNGIVIGSGPWVCREITGAPGFPVGQVGGSCSQNADGSRGTQDVTLGGRILLKANDNYMRGPPNLQGSSLQKTSWADKNNDGVVNIFDIADAAIRFGNSDVYWDHPLLGTTDTIVDIGEIATIAFYYDHGITKPFAPASLTGLDQAIDPYRVDLTTQGGPVMYYQGGARSSSGQWAFRLAPVSGSPVASSFSATLKTESGVLVGTASGVSGGSPGVVVFQFSGISPGLYQLEISFAGGSQPVLRILATG